MRDYLKKIALLSLSLSFVFPLTAFSEENEMTIVLQTRYRNGDVLVGEFSVHTDSMKIDKNNVLDWSVKNSSDRKIVFEREVNEKSPLENSDEVNLLSYKEVDTIHNQIAKMQKHIQTFIQIEPAKKKVHTNESDEPLVERAYSIVE